MMNGWIYLFYNIMILIILFSSSPHLVFQDTGSDCMANIKHSPVQTHHRVQMTQHNFRCSEFHLWTQHYLERWRWRMHWFLQWHWWPCWCPVQTWQWTSSLLSIGPSICNGFGFQAPASSCCHASDTSSTRDPGPQTWKAGVRAETSVLLIILMIIQVIGQ